MSDRPVSPQTLEKWTTLKKVLESERGRNVFRRYIKKRFPDETECMFLISVEYWEQFNNILKSKEIDSAKISKIKKLSEEIQSSDVFVIERPILERLCNIDSRTLREVLEEVLSMIVEDSELEELYQDFYTQANTKKGNLKVEAGSSPEGEANVSQEQANTSESGAQGAVAKLKSWCLIL